MEKEGSPDILSYWSIFCGCWLLSTMRKSVTAYTGDSFHHSFLTIWNTDKFIASYDFYYLLLLPRRLCFHPWRFGCFSLVCWFVSKFSQELQVERIVPKLGWKMGPSSLVQIRKKREIQTIPLSCFKGVICTNFWSKTFKKCTKIINKMWRSNSVDVISKTMYCDEETSTDVSMLIR